MNKKSERILALLNNRKHRNLLLGSFNKSTLDEENAPLGKGEMTILRGMESLDKEHDQCMQDLKSRSQSE